MTARCKRWILLIAVLLISVISFICVWSLYKPTEIPSNEPPEEETPTPTIQGNTIENLVLKPGTDSYSIFFDIWNSSTYVRVRWSLLGGTQGQDEVTVSVLIVEPKTEIPSSPYFCPTSKRPDYWGYTDARNYTYLAMEDITWGNRAVGPYVLVSIYPAHPNFSGNEIMKLELIE